MDVASIIWGLGVAERVIGERAIVASDAADAAGGAVHASARPGGLAPPRGRLLPGAAPGLRLGGTGPLSAVRGRGPQALPPLDPTRRRELVRPPEGLPAHGHAPGQDGSELPRLRQPGRPHEQAARATPCP